MKLVSWNVAGFRAVLKKGFEDFFNEIDAERKGYSGTLVYTKKKPLSVTYGMGIDEHDHEGRIITLEFEEFYLVTEYVPNVKRELERLDYRMVWEDDFRAYLKKLEKKKPVIVCGDLNVAHEEIDIKNAKANRGNAGFADDERGKFSEILDSGFIDTFRYFYPEEEKYSWWSYMGNAREKNIGWRIDYFICSKSIIKKVKNPEIYNDIFGSDHCPIGLEVDLK